MADRGVGCQVDSFAGRQTCETFKVFLRGEMSRLSKGWEGEDKRLEGLKDTPWVEEQPSSSPLRANPWTGRLEAQEGKDQESE